MPLTDPFSSLTNYPTTVDNFPTVVDGISNGSLGANSNYSILWASHYNKMAKAIEAVETSISAQAQNILSDGSLNSISYIYSFPLATLTDVVIAAENATNISVLNPIPTSILPFECVLTTLDSSFYWTWPTNALGIKPLFVSLNNQQYQQIFGTFNLFGSQPQVKCTLENIDIYVTNRLINYTVNSYCIMSDNCLTIRGCIMCTNIPDTPTFSADALYSNASSIILNCTIFGVS